MSELLVRDLHGAVLACVALFVGDLADQRVEADSPHATGSVDLRPNLAQSAQAHLEERQLAAVANLDGLSSALRVAHRLSRATHGSCMRQALDATRCDAAGVAAAPENAPGAPAAHEHRLTWRTVIGRPHVPSRRFDDGWTTDARA